MSTDPTSAATDLSGRAGFDPNFLGVPVTLPVPVDRALPTVLLGYTHFSVLMRPDRRLAAVTGVGIDGATLRDLERADDWQLDPRLPADQQTGEGVYARNDLDRGHLVRRRDPVWGSTTVAAQANLDTFHFTNAAPQAAVFNQGETLWAGLENHLLDNAATYDRLLVVFTGCVLDPEDSLYRGVQLPLRFFKVATFLDAGDLAATGYVLDQTPWCRTYPLCWPTRPPPGTRRRWARSAPSRSPSPTSPPSPASTSPPSPRPTGSPSRPVPAPTGSTTRPCGDRSGPLTTLSGGAHQPATPAKAGPRCRRR